MTQDHEADYREHITSHLVTDHGFSQECLDPISTPKLDALHLWDHENLSSANGHDHSGNNTPAAIETAREAQAQALAIASNRLTLPGIPRFS